VKKRSWAIALLLLAVVAATADSGSSIFEFHRMAPVMGPFVGTANPIRGVPGAGLNWQISSANAELSGNGHLEIRVRGLVLNDPRAGTRNHTNPLPTFRAILNCQVIDSVGSPGVVNVSTTDFPATPAGDARIEQTLILPGGCFAPILFVTTSTGSWLAVSGF
jgi:hypothetical protein